MLELRAGEGREATNKQDATHTRPVYFQLKLRQEQTHFQQTHKTAGQLRAAYETSAEVCGGLRGVGLHPDRVSHELVQFLAVTERRTVVSL